jgi:hypothetical protein
MAATTDLDTATAVLAAAREDKMTADAAEVRMFQRAADWAAMHSVDSLGPAALWEGELPIAGEGAPLVAEFCVAEFALAVNKSTDAGQRYLGPAVEVRYRLPKIWALVVAGRLPVWRAIKIAESTMSLPMEGAGFVDRHVAPVAAKLSYAQMDRVVEEARVRFDPIEAEHRRLTAADGRHLDVETHQVSYAGTVRIEGELDLADALDFDDAVTAGAQRLADLGCEESLDVRRSIAVGELARNQGTLEFPTTPRRQVVMNVHTDGGPFARVDNTRSLHSLDQVRDWCEAASVHVRQVIDLNEHRWNKGHDPTPLLREQIMLTHPTCVFMHCTRPSRSCDCDHIIAFDEGGQTCSCNLVPLCRHHHRYKTHGGWTYERTGPRTFRWTSPLGRVYIRDDEDRRHI